MMLETLRTIVCRNPRLSAALEFLFRDPAQNLSFHALRIEPLVSVHRNLIGEEPFLLPRERVGGTRDVPMAPLIRNAVDETLRAYSRTRPHLLDYVGRTPISPYGSMGLSVSRWGYVDWDYIRDLDWRIFLPPELGQLSGFKSELERILTGELLQHEIHPILGGKDEQGQPQVQLRDRKTAVSHGFHFFLIAMKPGFVRGNIHHDGGYSPHFAYFPKGSLDEHLESANLLWSDVIEQQREDYVAMFNQLSFNIYGENTAKNRMYKTRGWYLHKAFKWYATLARMRGLSSLEEDLLYEYEHFRGSEAELSYFARYRYYARMTPSPQHLNDVDRDLARTASIAFARARDAHDPWVGKPVSVHGDDLILLETVPENFQAAAGALLRQAESSLPDRFERGAIPGPTPGPIAQSVRFADNLAAPSGVQLDGYGPAALIPAEWSMVFCDAYVRRVAKKAAEENRPVGEEDIHLALAALLASFLVPAAKAREDFSGAAFV
jgi:hypothetical protein